jgi:SAM-dependent methyltransferase
MTSDEALEILENAQYWHYRFQFPWGETVPTRPGWAERVEKRKEHFFHPLLNRFGGSLVGRNVLDLGCCQGYWSMESRRAGAENVLGLDSSADFILEAQAAALTLGIDKCTFTKYHLEDQDWWSNLAPNVTLMLGLHYHLTDPIHVLRKAMQVTREIIVIDGEVALDDKPCLHLRVRTKGEPTTIRSDVSSELRTVPTATALIMLLQDGGFKVEVLKPGPEMPADYHAGTTVSIIASRS